MEVPLGVAASESHYCDISGDAFRVKYNSAGEGITSDVDKASNRRWTSVQKQMAILRQMIMNCQAEKPPGRTEKVVGVSVQEHRAIATSSLNSNRYGLIGGATHLQKY